MITVTEVPWSTHSQALMALRMAVFVREQGIALDDELDPDDAKHRHFLAFDEPPTAIKRSSKSILLANFSFLEAGKLHAPLL